MAIPWTAKVRRHSAIFGMQEFVEMLRFWEISGCKGSVSCPQNENR